MGSTAVERELADTKAKIEELEKEIRLLESEIRAAPEGTKAERSAIEEKQRLVADQIRAEERLAALQAQLTPPAGAPCSIAVFGSAAHTMANPLHCLLFVFKE